MARMRAVDAAVLILEKEGSTQAFGLPGAAINPFYSAMKKHGGKYPGPLDFIKTMSGIKLDALRGPLHLDDRLTVVQNIYIKKVEKKKMFGYDKEELWNTVVKTYPNVNQFGQFNKEEFLKTPVYSRDFPPCKFCN